MNKIVKSRVAILLNGCGRMDGSEIQESMSCIFALSKRNIEFDAYSINDYQTEVCNHNSGEKVEGEKRNMLVEAARITRTEVKDIKDIKVNDYKGLVFPGGFGVAKNLCNFAYEGENFKVNTLIESAIKDFHKVRL